MANKYIYTTVLQGNYGYGWDDICECDSNDAKEVKALRVNLREYRENEPNYPHRIIKRRTLNPDYHA